jgi:hypothetical protein
MDTLTMVDRGDCCSAQARMLVGKGDLRLMLCFHHGGKHRNSLLAQGWEVIIENHEGLKQAVGVGV